MYGMPRKDHKADRKVTRLVSSVVKEERRLSLEYYLGVEADTDEWRNETKGSSTRIPK